MKVRLAAIPQSVVGTDITLKEIGRLIEQDLQDQRLRLIVSRILRDVASKNHLAEAQKVYRWISSHIRYQKDPIGIETVQSPLLTIRIGVGDCDDHAALFVGMVMAVGLPGRFRVVGYDKDNLAHIWPEVYARGRWWVADTTEYKRGFGWRPPRFPFERIYSYKGRMTNMNGLAAQLPITRGEVQDSIKKEVFRVLTQNWRAGLINESDVASYLRVIDEGNFPAKSPLLVNTTRDAIAAFAEWAPSNLVPSTKPIGTMSGLEGLDGFLSSVWNGVKNVVGGVVKTGAKLLGVSSPQQVVVQPTIEIPSGAVSLPPGTVQAPVTAEAARAGVSEFLKSPVVLVGLGLLAFMVLQPGRRR